MEWLVHSESVPFRMEHSSLRIRCLGRGTHNDAAATTPRLDRRTGCRAGLRPDPWDGHGAFLLADLRPSTGEARSNCRLSSSGSPPVETGRAGTGHRATRGCRCLRRGDPAGFSRSTGQHRRSFDRWVRGLALCPSLSSSRQIDHPARGLCLRPLRRSGTPSGSPTSGATCRRVSLHSVLSPLDRDSGTIPLGFDRMRVRQGVSLAR